MLLTFPIDNAPEPQSLWSVAYPKSKMRWEWDESGDDRVARLWHLREELSRSEVVVYTKWYRGRATFFSRDIFAALLADCLAEPNVFKSLSHEAKDILEILEGNSPLSTKELKRASGLNGRANEARYQRALKELWSRFLIVGFGEVDEGAFPSLAVGATKVLFEELYQAALNARPEQTQKLLNSFFERNEPAAKFHARCKKTFQTKARAKKSFGEYVEFNGWLAKR